MACRLVAGEASTLALEMDVTTDDLGQWHCAWRQAMQGPSAWADARRPSLYQQSASVAPASAPSAVAAAALGDAAPYANMPSRGDQACHK